MLTRPMPDLKTGKVEELWLQNQAFINFEPGSMSPAHVSSGIYSGSVVTFLLPVLFCSRCL